MTDAVVIRHRRIERAKRKARAGDRRLIVVLGLSLFCALGYIGWTNVERNIADLERSAEARRLLRESEYQAYRWKDYPGAY